MCKVLDEIENRGRLKGNTEGELNFALRLIKKGLISLKQAAEELGMTPKKLEAALNNLDKSAQKS